MIRPPPDFFMCLTASRVHRNTAVRLVSSTAFQSESLSSSIGTPGADTPAFYHDHCQQLPRIERISKANVEKEVDLAELGHGFTEQSLDVGFGAYITGDRQ